MLGLQPEVMRRQQRLRVPRLGEVENSSFDAGLHTARRKVLLNLFGYGKPCKIPWISSQRRICVAHGEGHHPRSPETPFLQLFHPSIAVNRNFGDDPTSFARKDHMDELRALLKEMEVFTWDCVWRCNGKVSKAQLLR